VSRVDARGCPQSGATPAGAEAYERALGAFLGWRCGSDAELALALDEAPGLVMAHVLQGWLRACSRDPRRIRSARPMLVRAAALPANARERMHLAALAAALDDDYERAKAHLGRLLRRQPRDVVALHVAHSLDYVTGDLVGMRDRVGAVRPAWSPELPGYGAVLAMHAFSLEECGDYGPAEATALAALALDSRDARAHHVMAHVFEMTARGDAGVRWMSEHVAGWGVASTVATHCFWHLALFHLGRGELDLALALYDQRIGGGNDNGDLADLIDRSALLWRIRLSGGDPGRRWTALAAAWAPFGDDAFCSFNDMHAMLAFVGADDWQSAHRLERVLLASRSRNTRHGRMTRQLGLDACRAVMAFGRGDDALAVRLLTRLPARALRLGGSHAQRDVLELTCLRAIERLGRTRRAARVPAAVTRLVRDIAMATRGAARSLSMATLAGAATADAKAYPFAPAPRSPPRRRSNG
jgi:tetratricopeptide (TPR) repeat protein